jgi:phospholipid/cholesterol/gamma-HCH transport system substrate-binding protein
MSRSPTRDLIAGIFVLAGLVAVAFLAFRVGESPFSEPGGLVVYARFDETGGLKPRAPVDIAGVKVGRVTEITLDDDFRARVRLEVDGRLALPVDTSASIVTAGLLGDRYVSLQLGAEEEVLKSGGEIGFTESAVLMERLIGKLVHNVGARSEE